MALIISGVSKVLKKEWVYIGWRPAPGASDINRGGGSGTLRLWAIRPNQLK